MLKALARLAQCHARPRTGSHDENPSSACSGLASSDAPNLSARRDELFELTELLNAVGLGPQGDGDILVVFDAGAGGAGVRSFGVAGPSPEVSDGRESNPRTADEGEKAVRHTLNLWRHELGEVPEWVWQQTELRVLILANNGLTALPPGIGRLHRLTTLDLGHNALTSVPDELGNLNELSDCLYLHVVVEGHGEVLCVQGCVLVGQGAEVFQCLRADCQRLGVLVSEGEPVGEVVQCLRERQPVALGIGFRQGPVAGDGLFCCLRGEYGMPQRTKAQGVTVQCCGKFRPTAVPLLLDQLTLYGQGFGCYLFCVHPLPGVGELGRQGAQRGAETEQMGAAILLGQRPEAVHGFCRCRSGLRIAPHVFQPGGQ